MNELVKLNKNDKCKTYATCRYCIGNRKVTQKKMRLEFKKISQIRKPTSINKISNFNTHSQITQNRETPQIKHAKGRRLSSRCKEASQIGYIIKKLSHEIEKKPLAQGRTKKKEDAKCSVREVAGCQRSQ